MMPIVNADARIHQPDPRGRSLTEVAPIPQAQLAEHHYAPRLAIRLCLMRSRDSCEFVLQNPKASRRESGVSEARDEQ
jgi:hypothetical protein